MTPTVLSIAGLDPSGGAGIAADLKTATAMGVYGMAALTTVTVQHPGGVDRVVPLAADVVAEQVGRLLDTMPIGAIKIGLLGSADIAEALIPLLEAATAPVVVDPVRVATSGAQLGHVDGATMMRLLGQVTLVTPNADELETLVGDMQPGRWAIEHGLAILHTGGHGNGDTLHDVLWLPDGSHRTWSHPRVNTPHTHGSGCTLSTAVAVGLAKGLTLSEAVGSAIQYTTRLIGRSADQCMVDANGPLLHFKSDG